MLRAGLALAFFAAAAAAAWLLAPRLAAVADARYAAQVEATLTAGGFGWATGEVDGLRATISGAAPSDEAARRAIALVAAISPALTVRDAIAEAPKVAPTVIPPRLEILKGEGGLTLTGVIAGAAMAEAIGGDATLVTYGAAPFGPDWPATAALLKEIASKLRHARITIADGAVAISALADMKADRADLAPLLARLRALGWRVADQIDAPPPALAAFRLTAAKSPGGAEVACAAADAADAAAIEAAAAGLGAEVRCAIGAGAPDDAWADAAIALLTAMAPLDAASGELDGGIATLIPAPPTTPDAADRARAALAISLPERYRLVFDADAVATAPDAPPPFVVAIDWPGGAGPVTISSAQPEGDLARAEASLGAYARALFPNARTEFAASDGAPPPPDWRRAARTALEALSHLADGEARITAGAITLSGAAAEVAAIRAAHDALAAAGPDWRIETRIAHDPAPLAAAQPLPPARCAAEMSGAATAAPIGFEPASATLTPTGRETVARIAAILARCEGARFEIGGHTDAQGSETGNLALSRARAEAVLTALIAAKAPPGRLTARGYGEARPIADNATEAGRALNRRIEFTLLEAPE